MIGALTLYLVVLASPAGAAPAGVPLDQTAKPRPTGSEVTGAKGVVAADHELASRIGIEVLREGGNAVDAAVATTLALGVLNPQSSGIGGGGFAVIWHAKEAAAYAVDFRETAPAAAARDTYTKAGVTPQMSRFGGLAVGVPGEVAGLAEMHRRWGTLPWKRLVAPAVKLAAQGYPCGVELQAVFTRYGTKLRMAPALAKLFIKPDGSWPKVGEPIVRPGLAKTLKAIGDSGQKAFYEGPIAAAMAKVAQDADGLLTEADLKAYRTKERTPLKGAYRGRTIYTMPPPSSGGAVLLQVLGMLEARKGVSPEFGDPVRVGLLVEALKHAFADRARWYGDPDFSTIPLDRLLSPAALKAKAAALTPAKTRPAEEYGVIAPPPDDSGTSHLSIIDADGNAVALTSTVNTGFGSLLVAGDTGIVLNNEMDDFTTHPGKPNAFGLMQSEHNSVAAGKRPLSSMTPTVVIEGSGPTARPVLVVGGSGGPRIITGTLQVLLNVLDHGDHPGHAVAAPRIHHQWMPDKLRVEAGAIKGGTAPLLKAGHVIDVTPQSYGAIQAAIVDSQGRRVGASDPRKHGQAAAY